MRNILFILLIISLASKGQFSIDHQAKVDSLNQAIKTAKHDSTLVSSWIAWDNIIYLTDPELDFILNQKIDSLCELNLDNNLSKKEKTFFLKSKSVALNNIGIIYKDHGDFTKAIEYYFKSLKIKEGLGDKKGIAISLNTIGFIYANQEEFAKAIEYKANKQPIGLYDGMKKFHQEVIELKPGDSIYFFTDGFADQFGGEKWKKFKYKPFKRFLIELQTKSMTVQEQLISTTFENWKGQLEQIDDVCIIGVKFEQQEQQ